MYFDNDPETRIKRVAAERDGWKVRAEAAERALAVVKSAVTPLGRVALPDAPGEAARPSQRRMFPIQNGPAVPWEVMAPHAHQAQRNHSQTLERLAERGGLGCSEAWAVIQGESLEFGDGWHTLRDKLWREYAERVNLHYDELERLRASAVSPLAMPEGLHPDTADLVQRFAAALAEKLRAAEVKYGYSNFWKDDDWQDECRAKLLHHLAKGDPRDVANYCAFMWHHGWPTALSHGDTPIANIRDCDEAGAG